MGTNKQETGGEQYDAIEPNNELLEQKYTDACIRDGSKVPRSSSDETMSLNKDENIEKYEKIEKNKGKGKNKKNKKSRRGKVIKNKFKNLKIYYVNIRGVKSKIDTLTNIIEEEKPHIICLNETLLKENQNIDINGQYRFYNNNENTDKWGVSIGIDNRLNNVTVEVDRKSEEFESLWLKISNDRIKIRIGNIYAPQESRTKLEVYENMYEHIQYHKQESWRF